MLMDMKRIAFLFSSIIAVPYNLKQMKLFTLWKVVLIQMGLYTQLLIE